RVGKGLAALQLGVDVRRSGSRGALVAVGVVVAGGALFGRAAVGSGGPREAAEVDIAPLDEAAGARQRRLPHRRVDAPRGAGVARGPAGARDRRGGASAGRRHTGVVGPRVVVAAVGERKATRPVAVAAARHAVDACGVAEVEPARGAALAATVAVEGEAGRLAGASVLPAVGGGVSEVVRAPAATAEREQAGH